PSRARPCLHAASGGGERGDPLPHARTPARRSRGRNALPAPGQGGVLAAAKDPGKRAARRADRRAGGIGPRDGGGGDRSPAAGRDPLGRGIRPALPLPLGRLNAKGMPGSRSAKRIRPMPIRLEKVLLNEVARASKEFGLIEPNDRIMVGVSGGKDSFTLLHLLRKVQERCGFPFSIVAVNLDQGHPGFPAHLIEDYLKREGYEYRMIARDTYS